MTFPQVVSEATSKTTFRDGQVNCAVSGGADSLAMLILARATGHATVAIHVDHGARPDGSSEAELVAKVAAALGADFEARRVEVSIGANQEALWRAARFSVLPTTVSTGHTMDDQAETVLVNLLRGSGLDGLSGMTAGPAHPILTLRRTETRAICAAMAITPFEDPTNDTNRPLRNRIRSTLMPALSEAVGRDLVPVLARQATLLRDEADLLDVLAEATVPDPADARKVSATPSPLARRALRRWLREVTENGGRGQLGYPPSSAEIERVLEVARGEIEATELAGGLRVSRHRQRLEITEPILRGTNNDGQ